MLPSDGGSAGTPHSLPANGSAGEGEADLSATAGLVHYQPWLVLLARLEIDSRFQGKFSVADVVQETLIEAWRDWQQFRGRTAAERRAWLRQILAHQLAHHARRYAGTQKRDLKRERSLDASLAQSSHRLGQMLPADSPSPSEIVADREEQVLLAEILDRLPADYREVLILRNLEGLTHEAIAQRMRRSVGAVRMLWVRALAALRQEAAHWMGAG